MKKPNVLMMVVDCLRSDRVLAPGRTCRTPNIDRLVRRGTSVPNIFVENSITAPSFTSIFTGRYAGNHGVIGMVGVRMADEIPTLAEAFAASGYTTVAEVTGPLNPILGIDRGFSRYNFRGQGAYCHGDWGQALLERLRSGEIPSPYFLLVHFWEVHVPRQVPPAFDTPDHGATAYDRSVSALDAYIGELLEAAGPETRVILTADHGECVGEIPAAQTLLHYFLDKLGLPPVDAEAAEHLDTSVDLMAEKPLLHRFAADISQEAGAESGGMNVGKRTRMMLDLMRIGLTRYRLQMKKGVRADFVSNLKQKVQDLSLFLAVARGNPEAAQMQLVRSSLAEHQLQHGYHVYDYLQRVPAVFAGEGVFPEGKRMETEVRQIDLLPTLIDAFGLQGGDSGFDGKSYYPLMQNRGGENRSIYLEARGGAQAEKVFLIRGVRRDGFKVCYAPFESEAPVEVYDLGEDPGETTNVSDVELAACARLRDEAEAVASSFTAGAGRTLSSRENLEMVKKLKDLGYM